MPGVRLVHETLRGGELLIEDRSRPYLVGWFCLSCQREHRHKTYHLRLDGEGAVIVSTTIYERLRAIGLERVGLAVANEVAKPPAQIVGLRRD